MMAYKLTKWLKSVLHFPSQNQRISIVALVLLLLLLAMARSTALSQPSEGPWRHVRTIYTADLGASYPDGLTFLPDANIFVTQPDKAALAELVMITMYADPAGTLNLSEPVADPLNVTFDSRMNRLVIHNPDADQFVEIEAGASGIPDPSRGAAARYGVRQFGMREARGMAIDPESGRLYILNATGRRIIRVTPHPASRFDGDAASRDGRIAQINLRRLNAVDLRGIAYNPSNQHLYVLDVAQHIVYELAENGQMVARRDISELNLQDPQGIVFAPSVDRTDDPSIMNLFILDSGQSAPKSTTLENNLSASQSTTSEGGQIVELSLAELMTLPPGTTQLPATLVTTVDTSIAAWNPSAPDPAGIAYWPLTGQLLVVDSEVEEMPPYWQGVNVFGATTSGTLVSTCTTSTASSVSSAWNDYSNEPTGIAINPNNNFIYVADDSGGGKVHEVRPGSDGTYCTPDDVVTTINFSTDVEDVAYGNNRLFIAGGVDAEVWTWDLGSNGQLGGGDDGPVTNFDTLSLGFTDLESVAYNWDSGTLFLASATNSERYLGEVTTTGTLLRAYDLGFMGSGARKRSGMTYAPGSLTPAVRNIYIVSRNIDNGSDPLENDGMWWEISLGNVQPTPTNTPVPAATNTPTPTNTPVPPTATSTPIPPTATDTPTGTAVPPTVTNTPTNTPIPPTATNTATPGSNVVYLSSTSNGNVGGIAFTDEDIVAYNTNTGSWSLHFDGSDVGLASSASQDIDAFFIMPDGSILFSVLGDTTIANFGSIDNSDIIRFIPTSLGSNTAGTFEWYFDGSDVGLTTSGENVDAIALLADGDLIISTSGAYSIPGVFGADEDLLRFTATSLGANTAGTWSLYFDGSDVGLNEVNSEDIQGTWIDEVTGDIYLSTLGAFSVNGLSGNGDDIFICSPLSLGSITSCTFSLYLDGATIGFGGEIIDGFSITGVTPPPATSTPTPTNTPSAPTATNTPTNTPSAPTPTNTPTNTPSAPTPTNTPTDTPSAPTATNTPTNTPDAPTATNTPTNTPSAPTATNTPTNTPSAPTATNTPTDTPSAPTATNTPAATDTPAPTNTPSPTDNLLENPGFELDTNNDGWPDVWTTAPIFSRSSELVLNGSYAGRYSSTSSESANVRQTINDLTVGATYDISGWVNIPQSAGSTLSFQPKVEWRNGSTLIVRESLEKYTGVTNGWVQFSGSLVAPAGTTNARLVLALTGLNGTIYLDDFVFSPQSTTLFAPANTTAVSALNNNQIVTEETAVSPAPDHIEPTLGQRMASNIKQLWTRFVSSFRVDRGQ